MKSNASHTSLFNSKCANTRIKIEIEREAHNSTELAKVKHICF